MSSTPRIYVACLASYNNGILHGKWIDCDQGVDAMQAEISAMLADSPTVGAEEWAIHADANFCGITISENMDLDKVVEITEALVEYEDVFVAAYNNFRHSYSIDYILDIVKYSYCGVYENLGAYAEEVLNDSDSLNGVPHNLLKYFDYEEYGKDMELNGEIWTENVGYKRIHIFRGDV